MPMPLTHACEGVPAQDWLARTAWTTSRCPCCCGSVCACAMPHTPVHAPSALIRTCMRRARAWAGHSSEAMQLLLLPQLPSLRTRKQRLTLKLVGHPRARTCTGLGRRGRLWPHAADDVAAPTESCHPEHDGQPGHAARHAPEQPHGAAGALARLRRACLAGLPAGARAWAPGWRACMPCASSPGLGIGRMLRTGATRSLTPACPFASWPLQDFLAKAGPIHPPLSPGCVADTRAICYLRWLGLLHAPRSVLSWNVSPSGQAAGMLTMCSACCAADEGQTCNPELSYAHLGLYSCSLRACPMFAACACCAADGAQPRALGRAQRPAAAAAVPPDRVQPLPHARAHAHLRPRAVQHRGDARGLQRAAAHVWERAGKRRDAICCGPVPARSCTPLRRPCAAADLV